MGRMNGLEVDWPCIMGRWGGHGNPDSGILRRRLRLWARCYDTNRSVPGGPIVAPQTEGEAQATQASEQRPRPCAPAWQDSTLTLNRDHTSMSILSISVDVCVCIYIYMYLHDCYRLETVATVWG